MGLVRAEDVIERELDSLPDDERKSVEGFAKRLALILRGTYVREGDEETLDERAPAPRRQRAKDEASHSGRSGVVYDTKIRR